MDYPPREATRQEAEDVIAELNPKFLECRDRHAWRPYQVGGRDPITNTYTERSWRCIRCRLICRQELAPSGAIVRSKYEGYPDGYLVKGRGRVFQGEGRQALRLAATEEMARRINGSEKE